MKKVKIIAKNLQEINKIEDKPIKSIESPQFNKSIARLVFWDLIPNAIDAYNLYFDHLNLIYSKPIVIIEEKDNGRKKKKA